MLGIYSLGVTGYPYSGLISITCFGTRITRVFTLLSTPFGLLHSYVDKRTSTRPALHILVLLLLYEMIQLKQCAEIRNAWGDRRGGSRPTAAPAYYL